MRIVPSPCLVLDDAEAGLGDRPLALRHVEVLDPFDRVRLDGSADALADDVEEIHEDPGAEELVDLLFARVMTLHEPFDGARLVAAVVVDVHGRVGRVASHCEIDECSKASRSPSRSWPQMGR